MEQQAVAAEAAAADRHLLNHSRLCHSAAYARC